MAHQSCFAHIDRKFKFLLELQNSKWVKEIRTLFYDAIDLIKQKKATLLNTKEIEFRLNNLLLKKLHYKTHKDIIKIQGTLLKYRDTLLTFLFYENVPWDNNGSEQTFRCLKVKLKVSGSFKKLQQEFAMIRSIVDTTIKNKLNVFEMLTRIEKGELVTFDS